MENVFEKIKERGYIYQLTNENEVKKLLNEKPQCFYLGIDPTADSLHIGHFFALTLVRRLQKMGHHPIILIGGATALIGDPTGKKDLRKVLTKEEVLKNKKEVKELIEKFVSTTGENPAIIVDNSDWINKETYIDFMRNIGIHFNVNKMLATDCYKNRLKEGGLTFLEMGYMLMQAYDFVYLNNKYNCMLQIGGSDQWANILAGTELYRKLNNLEEEQKEGIQGLTCPLLIKADGEKMGKTASGTLWISKDKTTVYDFYQLFLNSFDEDVERLLSFFSDYEIEEIKKLCNENIINAKKIMAYEVTKLVHGKDLADKAVETSTALFEGDINNLTKEQIEEGFKEVDNYVIDNEIDIVSLLILSNIASSKREAKELINSDAISINNIKINDENYIVNKKIAILEHYAVLKKGKKKYLLLKF